MNTQSEAMAPLEANVTVPVVIPASRRLYWSVRRELWENRAIYIAPLAVAVVFLVAFLIGAIHPPLKMRDAMALDPVQHQDLVEQPYTFAAFLLMGTTLIVAMFYCLEALYSERRDRSILFWKSLPVSDLTTVLAKLSIPLVILPLATFAITIVTQWIMLLLSSALMLARCWSTWSPFTGFSLHQSTLGCCWSRAGPGARHFSGPCYRRWLSAWRRRLPFTLRTSPPCWAISLAAARKSSPARWRCFP
jgi:ABC-2 type transport system permease protein